jgi:deoxycytidine triphosphate deaminase
MSILSKQSIQQAIDNGTLGITSFQPNLLKEASYTFTLDSVIQIPTQQEEVSIGTMLYTESKIPEEGYLLEPGQMILGYTQEELQLNNMYTCFLSVRRSCASIGLHVLFGDMFAEPNTSSKLTLEIINVGPSPIRITANIPIIKGIFNSLS